MSVTILIPAAGASTRMRGADKLLELVDGVAQLRRIAGAALATGAPVVICLAAGHPTRHRAVADLGARLLTVADAATGMSASLRAGAGLAAGALMVVPADMPELDTADLARMLAAFATAPERIWRATAADGSPGHPVIFPAALLGALAGISGDEGGRQVLRAHAGRLSFCALPGAHATTDLDTPEAWAAWRAARG